MIVDERLGNAERARNRIDRGPVIPGGEEQVHGDRHDPIALERGNLRLDTAPHAGPPSRPIDDHDRLLLKYQIDRNYTVR
jgi:hypothetical protein